jgi:superfamily II DNA/RNA helicase
MSVLNIAGIILCSLLLPNSLLQMPAERQTMLFSATLPNWVSKVAKRYQKNPTTIDLVGEEQTGKLNEDVTLNIMQVRRSEVSEEVSFSSTLHLLSQHRESTQH